MTQHFRRQQKPRNTGAERRERRRKRVQRLAQAQRLPDNIREGLLLKGLARPATSVRGQLLAAVLAGAALDRDGRWIFDGSIRDLAAGGLADGKTRRGRYLDRCMSVFVAAGILERLDDRTRKGRPVVYAVRAGSG